MSDTSIGAAAPPVEGVALGRGASVEDAVTAALAELGISREDAEIEVISPGARAVPGERVSGSEAQVRVQRIDEYARRARAVLTDLLERMDIPARVDARRPGQVRTGLPPVLLDISGDDLGLLIGWRGETLRALQTVVNLMMGDEGEGGRRVILDVERYRARREEQVKAMAVRIAHQVKRTGESSTLDPMHAYERRAVHLALEGDEAVRTESVGLEPARRITIHPTGPAQGGDPWQDDRPRRFGASRDGRGGAARPSRW